MLVEIHPDNPSERKIEKVINTLTGGGVIIYPTDTVYALGCDIMNQDAIKKICRLRDLDPNTANLTFICHDISQLSEYVQQMPKEIFKLIKKNTPGPVTFILNANKLVPKVLHNKRKTIGVRIPNNNIALEIIRKLGRPILSISLKSDDEILEYFTNASEIYDDFEDKVAMVIDGGKGNNIPSTIVDCTGEEPEIIREGKNELSL